MEATKSKAEMSKYAIPTVPIYRLSATQYRAMTRLGVLTEEDKVKFLEGWLVPKQASDFAISKLNGEQEENPDTPNIPIYRLSLDQYHAMIEADILTEDDPVELLEGWLVLKMPKKPSHSSTTRRGRKILERIVPSGWVVDSQEPVTVLESEPEPDIAILRGDDDEYTANHPHASDIALVVEVSDATLKRDRDLKKRLYAGASIPVYWIINLVDRVIEVYTDPTGPTNQPDYRQRQVYGPNDTLPVILDGQEVGQLAVSELLP